MKVTAIVGSYRRGGTIDSAVDAMLAAAHEDGAETRKIFLLDQHIEFCTNCRTCMQQAGVARGECVIQDDMRAILDELGRSDAVILASPMNFGTVTAVMKRFIERLGGYAYWPWGAPAPKPRIAHRSKRAVIVASSAAPALLARMTSQMVGLMKKAARVIGAEPVGVLFIGLAGGDPHPRLRARDEARARRLGHKLARQARRG